MKGTLVLGERERARKFLDRLKAIRARLSLIPALRKSYSAPPTLLPCAVDFDEFTVSKLRSNDPGAVS